MESLKNVTDYVKDKISKLSLGYLNDFYVKWFFDMLSILGIISSSFITLFLVFLKGSLNEGKKYLLKPLIPLFIGFSGSIVYMNDQLEEVKEKSIDISKYYYRKSYTSVYQKIPKSLRSPDSPKPILENPILQNPKIKIMFQLLIDSIPTTIIL